MEIIKLEGRNLDSKLVASKRTRSQLSPESPGKKGSLNQKRAFIELGEENTSCVGSNLAFPSVNMGNRSENNWEHLLEKIEEILDEKLENIATKQDLNGIQQELDKLKVENVEIREELKKLKQNEQKLLKRVQEADKTSRRSNIVITGLVGDDNNTIQQSFADLCENVLEVNVQTRNIQRINSSSHCIELASPNEAWTTLSKGAKLKGTSVYIRKDYTVEESTQRYKLRQVKNALPHTSTGKSQIKGTSLIIDNKKYIWSIEGCQLVAEKQADVDYLKTLLNSGGHKQQEELRRKIGEFEYGVKPRRNIREGRSVGSNVAPAQV